MRHAFLAALHDSGSAVRATGWAPIFLTVHRGASLEAASALYAKTHSYGEYVFDWGWASAFQRHGRRYYPKLLGAVPFTPVPGSRLLARDPTTRDLLIRAIEALAREAKVSSAHVLFPDDADLEAFERQGWHVRRGVQFHWQQAQASPHADFAAFLATLHRDKRKKIAQERRRVREAGVTFRVLEGASIGRRDWDFFYRCYSNTYAEHGSTPYLQRAFFDAMMRTMPQHWVLFVAQRDGRDIACSLIAIDAASRTAWGRYWGAVEHVALLHFEACYYQPLEWCIAHGYLRFEGGAQGEHKMARGLLPVATASAHWIADPDFERAIADFLAQERDGVAQYLDELQERSPFKQAQEES
jgi:predicted N-acyltransferase